MIEIWSFNRRSHSLFLYQRSFLNSNRSKLELLLQQSAPIFAILLALLILFVTVVRRNANARPVSWDLIALLISVQLRDVESTALALRFTLEIHRHCP